MLSKPRIYFLLALAFFFVTMTLAQKKNTVNAPSASSYSQVYSRNPKDCKDVDTNPVSEGEDVPQLCKGYGEYGLYHTNAVYRVNLTIQDRSRKFTVPVLAVENDKAKALENIAVKKFGDKIEWLVANGKPFAFILRVAYFNDTQDEQTVFKPQNKAGEFLFVRGLKGYESLQYEISVMNTAFNPNEQARSLAYKFYQAQPK